MIQKRTIICVLGASHSTWNRGVSALATGTIECILERFPNSRIVFLDYGREDQERQCQVGARTVTIDIVNMRFSKWVLAKNHIVRLICMALLLKLLRWEWLTRKVILRSKPFRCIFESDVVAAISGGDSFSDIYGFKNLLYVALPQVLVLLCGKGLVLLPQTIGPFDSFGAKLIARYVLSRAKKVYSRDWAGERTTREILGGWYADGQVMFSYDVAFAVKPVSPKSIAVVGMNYSDREKVVGVNVSGLLLSSKTSSSNTFGIKLDYEFLVISLLDHMMGITDEKVLLIPHVFGGASHPQSDVVACEHIYSKVGERYKGRLGMLCGEYSEQEIKFIIGRCEFFVGSRMHACIAALSQCVPAVAIAYSDKFVGILEPLKLGMLAIDARTASNEEVLHAVQSHYADRQLVRVHLQSIMSEVEQSARKLFCGLDV